MLNRIMSMLLTFSGACGIEDGDSVIITGGGADGYRHIETTTVDRYNSKVHWLWL